MNEIKTEGKVRDKVKDAKAFCRENNISEAQCHLLRDAVRKWKYMDAASGEHDGEVSTYNVREDTLRILKERSLIAHVYKIEDPMERNEKTNDVTRIIREAFTLAKNDPFDKENESEVTVWRAVLSDLGRANAIRESLNVRCLRITESGREMARKWKEVIGAVEE